MPITPHAIGKPVLKRSFFLSQFETILGLQMVMVITLTTSKASSNLLNDDTYRCIFASYCVIRPDK